jgi:hypothetical protein
MMNPARALYTYQGKSGKTTGMENRAARVCELCGEQYPPHIMHCLQDGEPTSPATMAYVPARRSPAVLLGSFFAPDDLDGRETSAALVPLPSVYEIDDFDEVDDFVEEIEPELEEEEEGSSTRRALKAVDFAGLHKYLKPTQDVSEHQETAFALKPVRSINAPLLDSQETAAVPKSKKSLLDLETKPFTVALPDRPTVDAGSLNHQSADLIDSGIEAEAATSFKLKKLPSEPKGKALNPLTEPELSPIKKPGQVTARDLNVIPLKPKNSSKSTLADVEAPKTLPKKAPSQELKPIDPQELDNWKIEKPLASSVLKSIPLAQTAKRPSIRKRYIAAALLVVMACTGVFILRSLLNHTVEKKEQLASLAPVQEKVEISLHSNPSGARVSGTINGEPFSPRFSPGSLTAPKGANIELNFEYANYSPSHDQFVADAPRDLSVHLSLLPVDPSTRPQQVATTDPKETHAPTPIKIKSSPSGNKNAARPPIKTNSNLVKPNPPINTQTTGKRPPLPANTEL